MAAVLMDELLEEILFRFPPDDPVLLVRAALLCKRWCRLVSAPAFRRRYQEFHRAPLVLGVLCNIEGYSADLVYQDAAFFEPTSPTFRPRGALRRHGWRAVDARHGRVLLRSVTRPRNGNHALIIWDPVTGREQELPPTPRYSYFWNGAVLCAAAASDCDHLDCRSGPFLVVVVSTTSIRQTIVDVYSSEANAWIHQEYCRCLPF